MAKTPQLSPDVLAYASDMLRLLGHPVRLAIVETLARNGEVTVGGVCQALGEPQSTVSQHLNRMKARGLVAGRRDGTQVFYSVAEPQILALLDCVRGCCAPRRFFGRNRS